MEAIQQMLAMAKNHVAPTSTRTFTLASDDMFETAQGDDDVTVIEVPETVLAGLLGDVGETKFMINRLSGCLVHVLPRSEPRSRNDDDDEYVDVDADGDVDYDTEGNCRNTSRKVVLSGSRLSRRTTAQMFHVMTENKKLKYGACTEALRRKIRFVFDKLPTPRDDKVQPSSATRVPLPERWTFRSLAQYVEALTELDVPHFAHRALYSDGERHAHIVRNMLCQLINDPQCKPFLSTRTINIIIAYLDRNGFFPELRIVVGEVKGLMTTRSFNQLLRAAAIKRDLRLLCRTVEIMRECGVAPNGLTWVTLLETVESRTVHAVMINTMCDLGLLQKPYILQSAVPIIVKHDFPAFVSRFGSLREFMQAMDAKFGCVWFSVLAAREMIYVAKRMQRTEVISEVLEVCRRENIRLPAWPLHQVLLHMLDSKGLSAGVQFYRDATRDFGLAPSSDSMHYLFQSAWRARALNTCRVLWWYSCLAGMGSYDMRMKVFNSLVHNSNPRTSTGSHGCLTSRDYWYYIAGKLIVHVGSQPIRFAPRGLQEIMKYTDSISPSASPELKSASTSPSTPENTITSTIHNHSLIKYLYPFTPHGPLRSHQHAVANAIIDTDIRACNALAPAARFHRKLVEAVASDTRRVVRPDSGVGGDGDGDGIDAGGGGDDAGRAMDEMLTAIAPSLLGNTTGPMGDATANANANTSTKTPAVVTNASPSSSPSSPSMSTMLSAAFQWFSRHGIYIPLKAKQTGHSGM